jgi:Zn-dependent M28 family amino/carboxypeptidase
VNIITILQYAAALLAAIVVVIGCAFYYMFAMPGRAVPTTNPMPTEELSALAARLRRHVEIVALQIGDRHASLGTGRLNETAEYIHHHFALNGYAVLEQSYGDGSQQFRNISVELTGVSRPGEIIVVGAHYDSVAGSPGADDNASGIAALLELARLLKGKQFRRTIRLIAFPNEEMPLGITDLSGSVVSANESAAQHEDIIGMFSLEMLGYYSSEKNSQHFPKGVPPIFPKEANFIAFVANVSSRSFLRKAIKHFRHQNMFPSEGLAVPEILVPAIARSDNRSYWRAGFKAVMITDTAEFRNPHYHAAGDLPDTLDYPGFARVVMGLRGMLGALAQ